MGFKLSIKLCPHFFLSPNLPFQDKVEWEIKRVSCKSCIRNNLRGNDKALQGTEVTKSQHSFLDTRPYFRAAHFSCSLDSKFHFNVAIGDMNNNLK